MTKRGVLREKLRTSTWLHKKTLSNVTEYLPWNDVFTEYLDQREKK